MYKAVSITGKALRNISVLSLEDNAACSVGLELRRKMTAEEREMRFKYRSSVLKIVEYLLDRLTDRLRVAAESRRGECVPSPARSAIHRWRGGIELLWNWPIALHLSLSLLVSRRLLA